MYQVRPVHKDVADSANTLLCGCCVSSRRGAAGADSKDQRKAEILRSLERERDRLASQQERVATMEKLLREAELAEDGRAKDANVSPTISEGDDLDLYQQYG